MRNPVFIGRALAEKLNMEIGNRIVLTFQDINNELTSGAFNISGLFHTAEAAYDERMVYVRSEDLSMLVADELIYHEIAVMLNNGDDCDDVVAELNQQFDSILAQT